VTTFVLVRHRYIDDRLTHALAGGHVRQVVLLGAGYDTRAYRFATALAGRPVFEVDFPATSARKARILARHAAELPAADVRRVEIDFQTQSLEERLLASGFAKGSPTFFVWEGVSMYLRREAVKGTLRAIAALGGPGSEVAMDFWHLVDAPDLVSTAYRASASALSLVGEPVTFAMHPEDCVPFLEREGFRVEEVAAAATLEQRYVADRRRVHPAMYLVHAVVAG
jgi:methyltransferase (TIGR00027 family)